MAKKTKKTARRPKAMPKKEAKVWPQYTYQLTFAADGHVEEETCEEMNPCGDCITFSRRVTSPDPVREPYNWDWLVFRVIPTRLLTHVKLVEQEVVVPVPVDTPALDATDAPLPEDLTEQDEEVIANLVERFTARQLAEELVRRCGCAFDHRLPDGAPPVHECGYHRELRLDRFRDHPLTVENLEDLIDLIDRLLDAEPTNPDVVAWFPVLLKLRTMRADVMEG